MPIQEERSTRSGSRETSRPRAEGKFLFLNEEKLFIKGVTYGPFGPEGREFDDPGQVERDFHLMRLSGINSIRTYTVPPRWLLDAAERHGLWVMVGLAWEQHVAFLEDPAPARRIVARVREEVSRVRGHPAILCYAVGNEIPAPIVRWHGRNQVEAFLERLYREVKALDPEGLVTYVNYPTTEYLAELPFLDFLSFNVYLEQEADLRAYIARLQNLAGERPLLMAELGLDAAAHGEEEQARALDWQIRAVFEGGCAGAMVFAWTDQWYRGGEEILDWSFGITTRDRRPKPALHAVRRSFQEVPFIGTRSQPLVSVVVCSYNGARTIRETLEHLSRLRYPAYEVIVVDDGSTDDTAQVASEFDVRLIRTPNRGLSRARNTGLAAANGEIVAYIDDDAYPDPHWLAYLVATFEETDHVGVGGPNLPPPDEGPTARCVARAPGGPIHVLLSDTEAEHLPGCNMAFRTERLRAIGGFDARFRAAGDDVDVCWRLQEKGWTLGFNPTAVVWHRRRDSVKRYWRQQRGYGRAEAMLERKWPEKYNPVGHVSWAGRLYNGPAWGIYPGARTRIYQGTWGTAPFQSLEERPPGLLAMAAALPESWLLVALLGGVGFLGAVWSPLLLAFPIALLFALGLVGVTVRTACNACRGDAELSRKERLRSLAVTSWLHLIHPLARLSGRISSGLAPWRRYVPGKVSWSLERTLSVWTEVWRAPDLWLKELEEGLRHQGLLVRRGGDYDRWDLEVRSGALGFVRILMAVEEHGQGRQLGRVRFEPRWGAFALVAGGSGALLSLGAFLQGAWLAGLVLGGITVLLSVRCLQEHAAAILRAGIVARRLRSTDVHPGLERLEHLGPERPPFRRAPSPNGVHPARPRRLAPLRTGTSGVEG
jgi:O-antigen biosynthesis protein